ncbi:MAG: FKBP-type peptidyl-prolyl cis-trans isomerase [Bacteroidetes bacterium]|nr:FKBP-type peptidyl-prolyl cis-trans isomerase [Bacteroidota bacterium]
MKNTLLLIIVLAGLFISCARHLDNPAFTQYQLDTASISSYIRKNNIIATKLNSGVWFAVDSATVGTRATFTDSVMVTYKMKLLPNETVVDESSNIVTFGLANLIGGIQLAMPYYQLGSKGRIFIPSYYGYQDVSMGSIPANSNLIFEFKLSGIKDYKLTSDISSIDNYIKNNSFTNVISDPSGLRYKVDSVGSGSLIPMLSDSVIVNYSLSLLSGEVVQPFTKQPIKYLLEDQVLAWKIGLPEVPEGSYVTLFVPSSLGFGSGVVGNNGARYANLIYHIKLLKVNRH